MRRISTLLLILIALGGCNYNSTTQTKIVTDDKDRVWAFIQFNVPEEGDKMESYYYYGLIARRQYQAISNNKLSSGFILLKDARYWGNDDKIHSYRDRENSGDITFRIEDIRRMVAVNVEPRVGLGYEQFEQQEKTAETTQETTPAAGSTRSSKPE